MVQWSYPWLDQAELERICSTVFTYATISEGALEQLYAIFFPDSVTEDPEIAAEDCHY